MLPSFLDTNTVGADHALTLCSIWPSSSILSTSSCCILIFLGDNFLGLQRIGLVDPVSISCTTASVRPVIGVPGAGNVCMCLAKRLAARALVAREFARCVEYSSKCGGSMHSPALRSVSRVPIFCMACISSTRAMRVRAGIITGLHLQSFDFFVQGSELYSSIGTFQSSASGLRSCTHVCSASTTPAVGPQNNTIQYNTIQCESLVGQVAHPICLIRCGRASLLFGAFVQVGQCCWIVGYIAYRFAVGLCVLTWLVVLLTLFGLVGGCVMCFLG